jgi:hypothetical protein
MNRTTTRTLLLALAVAAATTVAAEAQDEAHKARRRCSEATLKGDFALLIQGTRPVANTTPTQFEQVLGTVVLSFDGEGGFTQVRNSKGSTVGVERDVTVAGTYSVDADCSGEWSHPLPGLPVPGAALFQLTDNGNELMFFAVSPPPVMLSGSGRRVWTRGQ